MLCGRGRLLLRGGVSDTADALGTRCRGASGRSDSGAGETDVTFVLRRESGGILLLNSTASRIILRKVGICGGGGRVPSSRGVCFSTVGIPRRKDSIGLSGRLLGRVSDRG